MFFLSTDGLLSSQFVSQGVRCSIPLQFDELRGNATYIFYNDNNNFDLGRCLRGEPSCSPLDRGGAHCITSSPPPALGRDPEGSTFALAEASFYHFGLLLQPNYSRALLNWALVLEHVHHDPDRAGEMARRLRYSSRKNKNKKHYSRCFYFGNLPIGTTFLEC